MLLYIPNSFFMISLGNGHEISKKAQGNTLITTDNKEQYIKHARYFVFGVIQRAVGKDMLLLYSYFKN